MKYYCFATSNSNLQLKLVLFF